MDDHLISIGTAEDRSVMDEGSEIETVQVPAIIVEGLLDLHQLQETIQLTPFVVDEEAILKLANLNSHIRSFLLDTCLSLGKHTYILPKNEKKVYEFLKSHIPEHTELVGNIVNQLKEQTEVSISQKPKIRLSVANQIPHIKYKLSLRIFKANIECTYNEYHVAILLFIRNVLELMISVRQPRRFLDSLKSGYNKNILKGEMNSYLLNISRKVRNILDSEKAHVNLKKLLEKVDDDIEKYSKNYGIKL